MATNLLLEGDDLEALLVRAQAEGGPDARIVRAEKIRHGGVMGFFARESFEVAIEVPDEEDLASEPGAGLPTRSPVETLLERIQEQLIDTTEIGLIPGDPVTVDYPQPEPAHQPDADTPPARPAFTPFGGTFEAALEAVGVVIAPAEPEPMTQPEAQTDSGPEAEPEAEAEPPAEAEAEAEAEPQAEAEESAPMTVDTDSDTDTVDGAAAADDDATAEAITAGTGPEPAGRPCEAAEAAGAAPGEHAVMVPVS
ncbi:MAG: hypothetical protein WAL50_20030, partial [Kineosporiaceae bacterium]